jgi:hypothetical protein
MAIAALLLREFREDAQRFQFVWHKRLDRLLLGQVDRVPNETSKIAHGIDAKWLWAQRLSKVCLVTKSKMIQMYAGSFWVATIVLKGVHQETQLETQGDHRPILWLKVPEERHATAEVAYIINAEKVEIVEVDLCSPCCSSSFSSSSSTAGFPLSVCLCPSSSFSPPSHSSLFQFPFLRIRIGPG